MNKIDVSVQLYTARKFQPYKDIFEFISSTGIKNIELFALSDFDEKELKDLLQEFGLSSMSAHISYESFENLESIISKIKYLNIKHAIIPAPRAIPGKDFRDFFNLTENEWFDFSKNISNKIKIFSDNGLTLGYHNHSFEFDKLQIGKFPMELILDEMKNSNLKLMWLDCSRKTNRVIKVDKYKNQIIACHKDFYSDNDMLNHDNQVSIGEGL